ncbi:hypothetical protein M3Y97_00324500 [Aphelenchoides bicaudatus]|nr:hypothetical protein M3Y97_00324500 [Aphelenchoides bicaudatus]
MPIGVPSQQLGAIYDNYNAPIEIRQIPVPKFESDELLVKVLYSGICHSDVMIWHGEMQNSQLPMVGGHEAIGIVAGIGSSVKDFELGEHVGITFLNSCCLSCEFCKLGLEMHCSQPKFTGYSLLGTFQQFTTIKSTCAVRVPDGLDLAKAAPALCAVCSKTKTCIKYCSNPDQTVTFSDNEDQIDEPGVSGALSWYCQFCPSILTEPAAIRTLAPCGHILCDECSRNKFTSCAVKGCKAKVLKILKPCIQESDPIDEKAEAEKNERERIMLCEKLDDVEKDHNDLTKNMKSQEKRHHTKFELHKQLQKAAINRKRKLKDEVDTMKRKYQLARFVNSIEDRNSVFLVRADNESCKSYYLEAATAIQKLCREKNSEVERELTDEQHRLNKLLREKDGITSFTAFKLADVRAGQWLSIIGAGGGLGSMAVQLAKSHGVRVIALDLGQKRDHCLELGAEQFVETGQRSDQEVIDDVLKITGNGVHAVLCLAPVMKTMEQSFYYVRPRGIIVIVGVPKDGLLKVPLLLSLSKELQIRPAKVTNRSTSDEILGFVQRKQIDIPIEIIGLRDLPKTFERLDKGEVNGRIVVDLWK